MRRQRQHWSMNEVHTQTVPGGGPEPGELLYTLGPDWKRIGLESLIRLAVSAFALGLAAYQGTEPSLLPPVAAALLLLFFGAAAAANLYLFRRYDRWLGEQDAEQ